MAPPCLPHAVPRSSLFHPLVLVENPECGLVGCQSSTPSPHVSAHLYLPLLSLSPFIIFITLYHLYHVIIITVVPYFIIFTSVSCLPRHFSIIFFLYYCLFIFIFSIFLSSLTTAPVDSAVVPRLAAVKEKLVEYKTECRSQIFVLPRPY